MDVAYLSCRACSTHSNRLLQQEDLVFIWLQAWMDWHNGREGTRGPLLRPTVVQMFGLDCWYSLPIWRIITVSYNSGLILLILATLCGFAFKCKMNCCLKYLSQVDSYIWRNYSTLIIRSKLSLLWNKLLNYINLRKYNKWLYRVQLCTVNSSKSSFQDFSLEELKFWRGLNIKKKRHFTFN